MKPTKPSATQENFRSLGPSNYQSYKQTNNNSALPPISKEKPKSAQNPSKKDEISHENLMNFLSKKFTQLAPVEENPPRKEYDHEKPQPPQIPTKYEQQKPNFAPAKLKSVSSQQNFQSINNGNNNNESPGWKNEEIIDFRDFMWENNYKIKLMINQFKDDNSKVKAKIGNLERENLMLQKQFDNWKLSTHLFYDAENKPYIDSETAKSILEDSNFYAVTLKKELKSLKEKLRSIEDKIKEHKTVIEAIPEFFTQKQNEATDSLQKLLYEKEKLIFALSSEEKDCWEKLSSELEAIKTQNTEISVQNAMAMKEISDIQTQITELNAEMEHLEKNLQDKDKEIERIQSELQALNNNKMQKFGALIKTQHNLPESYTEIQEKQNMDELEKKNLLIEQNNRLLQELTFQYQDTTRKSITIKQNLLKDIEEQTGKNQELMNLYISLQTQNLKEQQIKLKTDELANFNSSLKKTDIESIKAKHKEDFIFKP